MAGKAGFLTPNKIFGAGLLGTFCGVMQYYFGSADNFFDFRFTTKKNANDLAEFYGSEDFMEIFCIFPFVVEFMMKNGEFASDAAHGGWDQTVNTFVIAGPGMMQVSMAFTEQADEEDDGISTTQSPPSLTPEPSTFPPPS